MASDMPKPSFAKIAAAPVSREMNPPAVVSGASPPSAATPTVKRANPAAQVAPPVVANGAIAKKPPPAIPTGPASSRMPRPNTSAPERVAAVAKRDTPDGIANGMKQLSLEPRTPNLVVNGTTAAASNGPKPPVRRQSSQDSPRTDSNSDLGTKPPSLDGKSIASTNVLDEKESLRPDDSASVMAAAEDDDASIRGSMIAGRMGSDLAMRARGIALGDAVLPDRRPVVASGTIPTGPGVMTPQSTSSDQQGATSTSLSSDALNLIYRQHPDEKLLDAMKSQRDRLFLLRLENQLINFVQNSKEPYMDVREGPEKSLNTFYRMLAHKLADYYHMTHSYEPAVDAVRIFRTPFCRVPTSLLNVAAANGSNGNTPPPIMLPRKIMKRGEDAENGQQSSSPSKATSEVGSEVKERPAPPKENRPTRLEREEAYKLARERIFGNSEASENDNENSESRASSVSAKDKTAVKRGRNTRQRRDSDGFDSRHQYAPVWVANPQVWPPQPHYMAVPPNGHFPHQMPVSYAPGHMAPGYPQPPNPAFSPAMPPGPYPGPVPFGMPPPPQFPPQPTQQHPRYPPVNGTSPMMGYGSPVPPSGPQGFQPQPPMNAPPPYPNRGAGSSPSPMQATAVAGIPYPFGQLPVNDTKAPRDQHPIPGSYQRNTGFNPKTQSFVPGGNPMGQMHPPSFSAPDSHHGSPQPQMPSPHMPYSGGFSHSMPPPPPFANNGYSMARQASTSSMPPYHGPGPVAPHGPPHGPPHMSLPPQPPMPQAHPPQLPASLPPHPPPPMTHLPHHSPNLPNKPVIPQGPAMMTGSHLANYPPPTGLPQKPATGV
jgi:hypothetical protein